MWLIIFILIFGLIQIESKEYIFITSELINCNINICDGSISYPYDSFFYALNNHHFVDNQIYSFIFEPTETSHQLMLKETLANSDPYYYDNSIIYYDYLAYPIIPNNSYFTDFTNLSIELLGLPCKDTEFINSLYANELCLGIFDGESMVKVNIKQDKFDITISGSLTINNLEFTGLDVLYQFSYKGDSACYTSRYTCCQANNNSYCPDLSIIPNPTRGPLFIFNQEKVQVNQTWTLNYTYFKQLVLIEHTTVFEHNPFQINSCEAYVRYLFTNTIFDGYFSQGLIINSQSTNATINIPSLSLPTINEYTIELYNVTFSQDSFADDKWLTIFDTMKGVYSISIINGALLVKDTLLIFTEIGFMTQGSHVNISNLKFYSIGTLAKKNIFDFNQSNVLITNSLIYNVNILSDLISNLTSNGIDTKVLFYLTPEQRENDISGIASTNNIRFDIDGLQIIECYTIYAKFIQIIQGRLNINNITFKDNLFLLGSNIAISGINDNFTLSSSTFDDEFLDAQGLNAVYIRIDDVIGQVALTDLTLYNSGSVKTNQVKGLEIDHMRYLGTYSRQSNPVYILKIVDTPMNITNSVFQSLAANNGIIYIELRYQQNLRIENTTFRHNIGLRGGAMQITFIPSIDYDISVNMNNCLFENNSVLFDIKSSIERASNTGFGGAIYLTSDDFLFSNVTIINTKFINNKAEIAGGAIYWTTFPPTLYKNTFENNTAGYGNNIATKPFGIIPGQLLSQLTNYDLLAVENPDEPQYNLEEVLSLKNIELGSFSRGQLRLLQTQNILTLNKTLTFDGLTSGGQINFPLLVYLVDIYGQIVQTLSNIPVFLYFANFSKAQVPKQKNPNINIYPRASTTFEMIINGVANFSNITLSYWPASKLTLILNTTLEHFLPQSVVITYPETIQIDVSFRNCTSRERFDRNTGECFKLSK